MTEDNKLRNRACSPYEALLEDYVAGALNGADARRAAAHLETCSACRAAVEDALASARLLKMGGALAEDAPQPAPGFARIVMAWISEEERRQATREAGFWQPFVSLAWRFAATASLALGMLLVYAAGRPSQPQPNATVAEETQFGGIFAPDTPNAPADSDEVLMMVAESNHGNK